MPASVLGRLPVPATTRGRARLRQLLDIACAHFLRDGYEATAMDAIVAEAGGSKATLYRYFESKQALFVACVGHLCDEFLARLASIDLSHASLADGLRAVLEELVEVVGSRRHVDFYRLIVAGSGLPGVGAAWHSHGPMVWHRLLARLLADHPQEMRAVASGLHRDTVAEAVFDSLLSHLLIQTVILQRTLDAEQVRTRIEALIALIAEPQGGP